MHDKVTIKLTDEALRTMLRDTERSDVRVVDVTLSLVPDRGWQIDDCRPAGPLPPWAPNAT